MNDGRANIVTTGIRIQPVKKENNVTVIKITVSNIRLMYVGLAILCDHNCIYFRCRGILV